MTAAKQTPQQVRDYKPIFAQFAKIDEEQRMVFGYASTETRDQQGEIIRLAAIEAALPDYMRFANIREMHQPWAVGTAQEAAIDGTGFWLGAHVVDDDAWKKVKAKVYKGFSIGGKVTERDTADRSIITALELTEVSLVDRPANPDAVYTVVKRVDGVLREQPLQKWDCGIADHQHRAKVDASGCMAERSRNLQKLAASLSVAAVAAAAAEPAPIEKAAPKDNASGKFSTHSTLAAQAHKKRAAHDRAAAKARDEEKTHRAASARSLKSGDAEAVALHEHLAGAAASLAESHGRAASKYRELAARHESEMGKIKKEISMSASQGGAAVRTIIDAEKDAEAALAAFRKSVEDPSIEKSEVDHRAEARGAREQALVHLDTAEQHEESAAASREAGRKAKHEGKADEADEHHAEADVHEITAVGHHEVGDTLHELHAHHMEKAVGAEGTNHEKHGEMAKEIAGKHAESAQKAVTMQKLHEGYASGAVAKSEAAGHHSGMAAKYAAVGAARQGLAKRMTDVHTECAKACAAEATKAARAEMVKFLTERFGGESIAKMSDEEIKKKYDAAIADDAKKAEEVKKAAVAGVKPVKGLKRTDDGWVDVSGASFFGKRDLKDEERVALVLKGLAMPDGSFPVENKEDLDAAVKSIERAKDVKDKVQEHIIKCAKQINALDALPKEWAEIVTKVTGVAPAAAAAEPVIKDAGGAAVTDPVVKTAEQKAERVRKGMGIVACLARILEEVQMLVQSSSMEEMLEGDPDCPIPGQLETLCQAVATALRQVVEHETTEAVEGGDVEVYAAAAVPEMAKAVGRSPMVIVAKALRDRATDKATTDVKLRLALKKLADAFEKDGEKEAAEFGKRQSGASEDDLKKAVADRDQAVKALDRMTENVKAMAKESEASRAERAALRKRVAELEAQVKKLGEQPLPAKGVIVTAGKALNKGEDTGALENHAAAGTSPLEKINAAAPGAEKAAALIAAGEELRARTLDTSKRHRR